MKEELRKSYVKRYEEKRARRAPRLGFVCEGPSRAKQSFKDECNINNIMRRFEKTAVLEHVNRHAGRYGDFLDAPADYHEAANIVLRADAMFMSLPASVRKAFDNDPGAFLASVDAARSGDADQVDRLKQLGILQTTAQPAPAGAPRGPVGEPETAPEGPETPAPKKPSEKG